LGQRLEVECGDGATDGVVKLFSDVNGMRQLGGRKLFAERALVR
jgi:hypothetical protein